MGMRMEETRGEVQKILSEDKAGSCIVMRKMVMLVFEKGKRMGNTPNSLEQSLLLFKVKHFQIISQHCFSSSGSSNRILYFKQHELILIILMTDMLIYFWENLSTTRQDLLMGEFVRRYVCVG